MKQHCGLDDIGHKEYVLIASNRTTSGAGSKWQVVLYVERKNSSSIVITVAQAFVPNIDFQRVMDVLEYYEHEKMREQNS